MFKLYHGEFRSILKLLLPQSVPKKIKQVDNPSLGSELVP
jgi:hypothetical protein